MDRRSCEKQVPPVPKDIKRMLNTNKIRSNVFNDGSSMVSQQDQTVFTLAYGSGKNINIKKSADLKNQASNAWLHFIQRQSVNHCLY